MLQGFFKNLRGESETASALLSDPAHCTARTGDDLEDLNPSPSGLSLNGDCAAFDSEALTGLETANEFGKSVETGHSRTQPDTVGPNEQSGRESLAIIWFSCRELLEIAGNCRAMQLTGGEELSP